MEKDREYEFWSYEEMEAFLSELNETKDEIGVSIRRVMAGGRFFVTVEQYDNDD